MSIIEVEALAKTFRTRERAAGLAGSLRSFVAPRYREREAVKPVSFSLEPGELLAFIGPNGAGKSTTIKMLTGILFPTSGKARVLGLVPWQQRRKLSFHIASVYGQKSQLWYHLPPQDTFDLLARIYELDMEEYRKRRSFLVEVFDIQDYLRTPARKLSLGERMRCELAAALLHKPSVIFLDEPTIGLDVIAKQRIRDLIAQLHTEEGVTVFLTSHDAGDIEQVCRRAIVINHGEIILDAPVAKLKRDYLKVKTVDLLLEEPALSLLKTDSESGKQRLSIQLPASIHEEIQDTEGVQVLKAKGHGLKLAIDTSRSALEPVIAAVMQRSHILDMTISDPPMEEIIATIYGGKGKEDTQPEKQWTENETGLRRNNIMDYTAADVKKLREETGAPVADCKKALAEATTWDEARKMLKAWGDKRAEKTRTTTRETKEGGIFSYIHHNHRVGVLLELNCSTDFVARSESFRHLARELALQIAGTAPRYINEEDVPAEVIKEAISEVLRDPSTAHIAEEKQEEIINSKIKKALGEYVLMLQPWIRDESMLVGDLVRRVIAETGENIILRRFSRFELGE